MCFSELCPKWRKSQHTAGKVMASVFSDAYGTLFIDYLEEGRTVNSGSYMPQLNRMNNEISNKRLDFDLNLEFQTLVHLHAITTSE